MRWSFNRGDSAKNKRSEWADRFGAIGLQLDAGDMLLKSLAISVTGANAWVTGLGLSATHSRHGWQPFSRRFSGGESTAGLTGGEWCWRLTRIGQLLDRDPRPLRNPCVVETDGGYFITATVAETRGDIEFWRTATWRTDVRT